MLANHHAPASNDSPQGDSDYEIILTALMETARGRSFLEQYSQRNRTTETAALLTAIGRIENLLTSRSFEPADPSHVDGIPPSEPAAEPNIDVSDIEIVATEIVEIDGGPAPELAEGEPLRIEVTEVGAVSVEVMECVPVPLDVAAPEGTAIAFLGPDFTGTKLLQRDAAPPAGRTTRITRDPFADICALSDAEKIALFA
jgi:hypothetical protein